MDRNESASEQNGNNGNGAAPTPRPADAQTIRHQTLIHSPKTQSDQSSNMFRTKAILSSLRRRWFLAAFLGLLCGGGAAAAVWYNVPTPYTAFGELEVQSTRFYWPTTEDEALNGAHELASYKREMMRRLADPFVINAALQDTEIANSPTLQGVQYKDLWLEENLSISSSGEQFIRVSLSGERPDDLAIIVNGVIEAFKEEVIERQDLDRKGNLDALKAVANDAEATMAELRSQINRLDSLMQSANSEQKTVRMQAQEERKNQLLSQLVEIQIERIHREVQLATLLNQDIESVSEAGDDTDAAGTEAEVPDDAFDNDAANGEDDASAVEDVAVDETVQEESAEEEAVDGQLSDTVVDTYLLSEDPEFRDLHRRARDQQILVDLYQERVGPESELRVTAESELVGLQEELDAYRAEQIPVIRALLYQGGDFDITDVEQLRNEIDVYLAYEEELERRLELEDSQAVLFATSLIEREVLGAELADLESRTHAYDVEISHREVEIENGAPPIRVYYPAEVPRVPDKAKRLKLAGVAGMGLFALVAGSIVWLDLRTQRIDSTDDIEAALQLPMIGNIPIIPRSVNGASGDSKGRTAYWQSLLTESIDSARIILLKRAKDDGLKTIMISSATGGEGKTTLSCHLATSLARASKRVLLIDCDVRRPSVHGVFGLEKGPGFCEVICGKATLAEAVQPGHSEGLFVLSAGSACRQAIYRLVLDDVTNLLAEAKREYDIIVIDSAPVLAVADSMQLAPYMDAIMFSLRRDVSRLSNVTQAVQRLEMLNVPIMGAVAIGLDSAGFSSRYGRYYRYHNGEYPQSS